MSYYKQFRVRAFNHEYDLVTTHHVKARTGMEAYHKVYKAIWRYNRELLDTIETYEMELCPTGVHEPQHVTITEEKGS